MDTFQLKYTPPKPNKKTSKPEKQTKGNTEKPCGPYPCTKLSDHQQVGDLSAYAKIIRDPIARPPRRPDSSVESWEDNCVYEALDTVRITY